MFTPQRKAFPTPHRVGAGKSSGLTPSAKGKAVAVSTEAPPPPPLGSLSEASGEVAMGFDAGNLDDWMKFREAGLLDEAEMQRKDQEALFEKVSRLERELFDYQYNMGLLLIEKKDWSSKFDELRQALDETEEILKRERSAHLIAYSEAEKRAENLRIALSTEKQCGEDLERALREMQKAHAEVQSSSHSKLAEANALVDGIEEKSSVVNKNLHDAEAKLAEVNRKNSELDMKLRELEVRESLLQKERLSLATDRESFEATFYKQREDLKEWERKLRQREDMLCDGRQNFVGRELKAIESEKNLKQKERDLEVLEKKIDSSNSLLKEKEAEISKRVADLDVQEKEVNSVKSTLEMKEKALLALELKLNAREREGIQKLLAEQKDNLDLKLQQFDLEMEQKRKSLIEEFSSKEEALEQREVEVNHRENKVGKEEQALSKKAERIKEQNKELEARLTSLKEKEKIIKIKEKELEKEKQQLLADRESLENLNVELGKIKAEISQQELQICQETENLKLTEEERSEHSRLQLELQQEIEHTRLQKDFLMKEAENLREERQRFEKEWDALDEKKAEVSKEHNEVNEEKERLRKLQTSEEERLKREKQDIQDHTKKELEKLELEKESFRDSMKQEELLLSEKVKNEKAQMLQNFERKTRNLENEIQKRQEEMEKDLQERERKFQEEMEREVNNINVLKGDAEKEWEEVKSEGIRLENERKELDSNKQQLKSGQREIHEDSKMLMNLSRKVKKERECLMAERNNFLALVEKLRSCKACEEVIGDFVISDIQLPDCKERWVMPLPTSPVLNDRPLKNTQDNVGASDYSESVRPVSWIRKCTSKIFKSPSKRTDAVSASDMAWTLPLPDLNANTNKVDGHASLHNIEGARVILQERQLTGEMAHLSSETPLVQSDNIVREVDNESQSIDHSYVDSLVDGGPDDSQQSVPKLGRRGAGRKSKSGIVRTRSVKAVVKEANEFLGKASGEIENASLQSLDADHVKDSQEDSSLAEKAIGNTGRKRQRAQTSRITESEQNAGDSDGQSDSITTVGRRKKRQTIAQPAHVTGEKRYNLRRHKTTGEVSSTKAASKGGKSVEKESIGGKPKVDNQSREVVIETSSGVADDNVQGTSLLQVSTAKTVEFSDDRVVRFQLPRDFIGDDGAETTSVDPVEENARVEHGDEDGSRLHEIENDNEGEEEVEAEEGEGEGEEDEEEEEEDDEDSGEVSISRKIYKFFTT